MRALFLENTNSVNLARSVFFRTLGVLKSGFCSICPALFNKGFTRDNTPLAKHLSNCGVY